MKLRDLKLVELATLVVLPIVVLKTKVFTALIWNDFIPIMKLLAMKGVVVKVSGATLPFVDYSCPYWK
jgi:hypothetical protein